MSMPGNKKDSSRSVQKWGMNELGVATESPRSSTVVKRSGSSSGDIDLEVSVSQKVVV